MKTPFKLKNGSIFLSTEAPGGIYNSQQLKKIASLIETDAAIVKVTEDQRLALFVKENKVDEVTQELKKIGIGVRDYRQGLHQPTTCIGELCPDHKQDALGTSIAISEILAPLNIENSLRIGVNGCATCCVPCHTLDVAIVGDDSGYKINLGGKNSEIPEMASFMAESVPAEEVPELLKSILTLYKNDANEGESLQEVIERVGSSKYQAALSPYSQDASGSGFESLEPEHSDGITSEMTIDDDDLDENHFEDEIVSEDHVEKTEEHDISMDIGTIEDLNSDVLIQTDETENFEITISKEEHEENPIVQKSLKKTTSPSREEVVSEEEIFDLIEDDIDDLEIQDVGVSKDALDKANETLDEQEDAILEEDEDAFEAKLSESIEDTHDHMPEDNNSSDRDIALTLLTDISASDEHEEKNELGEEEIEVEEEMEDFKDEELGEEMEEDLLADAEALLTVQKISKNHVTNKKTTPRNDGDVWNFQGFHLTKDGQLCLSFSNGVRLSFDPHHIKNSKTFHAGSKLITIHSNEYGLKLEYDGICIDLTQDKAA